MPDADPPPANPAPSAQIVFPPATGAIDAPAIWVRGTAEDNDGVAAVHVNGVLATTMDGFHTWTAEVALNPGVNPIEVETTDALGNRDARAAHVEVVRRGIGFLSFPGALTLASPTRAIVANMVSATLVAVDLATGVRTLLPEASSPSVTEVTALA
ncbi:MAG TPA: hypothetical protein VF469_00435, partial [Kofleriaceae bacterium]